MAPPALSFLSTLSDTGPHFVFFAFFGFLFFPISFGNFLCAFASLRLQLSSKNLHNDVDTALGNTLNQYAGGKKAPAWVAWNDQPPGTNMSATLAHSKGVIAFDSASGFFVRHSTPRFPLNASVGEYSGYPTYARIYGQTFLCVSYSTSVLNELASSLLVNEVAVYDASISKDLAAQWPALAQLAVGERNPTKVHFAVNTYTSLGGYNFTDYAKAKACKCELYTDVVAPNLNSDMAVLSWGRPLMGSGCKPVTQYNVMDINGMTIETPKGKVWYNETKEHSKLAIAADGGIVCAGDINRMTSQATRGGGTTCFSNTSLWEKITHQIGGWMSCSTG